jgi:hypothetical protein
MKQINLGGGVLVEQANEAFFFTVKDAYGGDSISGAGTTTGTLSTVAPVPTYVGTYQIIPEGANNDVPVFLRGLLDSNHLGGTVLDKYIGLILAQGIGLYEIVNDEALNLKVRTWVNDPEIETWLNSWDSTTYLINSLEDLVKGGAYYSKLLRNVAGRLAGAPGGGGGNTGRINELQHVPSIECRREWPDNKGAINRVIVGDFEDTNNTSKVVYPTWTRFMPTLKPAMMSFRQNYRFGRGLKQPVLPFYWGVRNWISRSSDVPDVLNNLSENTLGVKWHIISPSSYWEAIQKRLTITAEEQGKKFTQTMLEEYKEAFLTSLTGVLAGKKNVGKFIHTESVRMELDMGKSEVDKWEFIPIDMKMGDFIKAQLEVSKFADVAISSGIGLAPSLSNIIADGRSASGSESLYSYKLFRTSSVYRTEFLLFSLINDVIAYNWPAKTVKMGFYSENVMKESGLSPTDRMANPQASGA